MADSVEKGFRMILCECGKKLRFPVSPEKYGTTVNIRCPSCLFVCRVNIPIPPKETAKEAKPSPKPRSDFMETFFGKNFGSDLGDLFKDPFSK